MPAESNVGQLIHLDDPTCAALLPRRAPDSHKGSHGTVVCVCGSAEYAGAALLAARAATRGGAGLVALAVPASLMPLFAGRVVEAITLSLPEAADGDVAADAARALVGRRDPQAVVVGPGLRESDGYRRLLLGLLSERPADPDGAAANGLAPIVVDGGGLNLLARSRDWWRGIDRRLVLTPHPGEFARLTGHAVGPDEAERLARSRAAAAWFGQVVVLKGARTVVAAPDERAAVAPFANSALATAGTGDVLAGLIGALLAQGLALFDAACLGVYLHGAAAERISSRLGAAGLVASDLPYEIARARAELARAHGTDGE